MSVDPENPGSVRCGPSDVSVYYKQPRSASELYWRFLPTKKRGWFYLVNYSVGESSVLALSVFCASPLASRFFVPVLMMDLTNRPRGYIDYWRVREAK